MNDIEILEEFIKYFEAEAISRKYRRNISITVGEDDIEAIENLIKRVKELERYKGLYENEMLGYMVGYEDGKHHNLTATAIIAKNNEQERLQQILEHKYIPKSKIKEKIEELEKEFEEKQENCCDFTLIHEHEIDTRAIIQVLQELLEEQEDK